MSRRRLAPLHLLAAASLLLLAACGIARYLLRREVALGPVALLLVGLALSLEYKGRPPLKLVVRALQCASVVAIAAGAASWFAAPPFEHFPLALNGTAMALSFLLVAAGLLRTPKQAHPNHTIEEKGE